VIQVTPQMRVLVAVEPVDGRKGIDTLAQLCREKLSEDPFSGCVFVFRNRSRNTVRVLVYDGQGFWLCQKRLSRGRFPCWPDGTATAYVLQAYQVQLLLAAGDPRARGAPIWRSVQAS
jgi:transposase